MAAIILLVVLFLLAAVVIGLYNSLIRIRVRVKNAWSQIDVQLKRRHDLIPNLVETVKGYAAHEKETLENVTKARSQASSAVDIKGKVQAENMLTSALRSLFAVVENYPNIKANQNFLNLQEELTSTENKISFARQYYNDEVMRLNTAIQTVPQNIIAQIFNFEKTEFLEIANTQEKEVPKVKF
jgi:LemA protein